MKIFFIILINSFQISEQISCIYQCSFVRINHSTPFSKHLRPFECYLDSNAKQCFGQLIIHYDNDNHHHLKYITYALGKRNHVIETQIEEILEKNNLKFVIYFVFLMESFHTNQLLIGIHIVCQTSNECAELYIEDLFHFYVNKSNPMNQLKELLYNLHETPELVCYNSEIKDFQECSISPRSTCIFNHTNILHQRCSPDLHTRVEFGYIITSKNENSVEKTSELIVCDATACNDESKVEQVKAIIHNYTLSAMNVKFRSNGGIFKYDYINIISLFLFIISMKIIDK
ncbi:hypothetical protein I4U23_013224 [Adineta vaga]|nr:hypothetical protein I4U23_013224 [Adineta vaga]